MYNTYIYIYTLHENVLTQMQLNFSFRPNEPSHFGGSWTVLYVVFDNNTASATATGTIAGKLFTLFIRTDWIGLGLARCWHSSGELMLCAFVRCWKPLFVFYPFLKLPNTIKVTKFFIIGSPGKQCTVNSLFLLIYFIASKNVVNKVD